jgi:hypothetical protein
MQEAQGYRGVGCKFRIKIRSLSRVDKPSNGAPPSTACSKKPTHNKSTRHVAKDVTKCLADCEP